ncbi:hypothetical protein XELAEV_18001191mg [Xenopus laevis]|nr:hypothetical protein XELAEV_18001191mg [Xenopus laevis]
MRLEPMDIANFGICSSWVVNSNSEEAPICLALLPTEKCGKYCQQWSICHNHVCLRLCLLLVQGTLTFSQHCNEQWKY